MPAHSFRPRADASRRAVDLFLGYLMELPLVAWIEAARGRRHVPGMIDAEAALRAVERLDRGAQIFAVKEAVLLALQRFETGDGPRLTRTRFATEHLRPATEHAALAVLVRQSLTREQFATLYAPFEPVIPVALLFGIEA
ncbi:MAG TPA: hypothetical protein VK636_11890 [Gemmatimonadaceae bacterium]|nr:hypothetical protein [Gemmatimonadaceae bacterium]